MTALIGAVTGATDRAVGALPLVPDEVEAQRATLRVTDHRPWPLPDRPWMQGQTWRELLFAHWPVEPEDVGRVMPPQLAPDTFDGRAWIGVTPFVVTGFRMRGAPPLPGLSSFPELNVRTYVTVDGKPGIWFLSLDAASRLAVAGARRSHRLPYFHARMSVSHTGDRVEYASERVSRDGPPAGFRATYRPLGAEFNAAPDSLDHFLTERYCHYAVDEAGRILRGDIHHAPWPLHMAEADIRHNSMAAPFGIALEGTPLLHFARRQDTLIWGLCPAGGR